MQKENSNLTKRKINTIAVTCIIIGIILGYFIGFYLGVKSGVSFCVDKAVYFLKVKNISIEIDEDAFKEGIMMYTDHINRNFPTLVTDEHESARTR